MSGNLHWIRPAPQPDPEVWAVYQLTRQFHQEIEYREEFDRHCQWYRATAEKHQRELAKMRSDINILGWFYRRCR